MKLTIKLLFVVIICFFSIGTLLAEENTEIVLNNGLKVFIKPMRAAPVVTINYWVKNGSVYESEGETGFSELISKLLFYSSLNYSNHGLKNELDKLGVTVKKNSSNDCQSFAITCASKNFDRLLELSVEGLFRAGFSDKDVNKAIKDLKEEIAELEKHPDIVVHNAMMETAFAIHPCKRPYYGLNPNFDGADTFLLNRFYNKNYTPQNTILVIVGDVNPSEIKKSLQKYLEPVRSSGYSEPELPKEIPQSSYREVAKYADVQKVYLSFGWKIPNLETSDQYAFYILAKLLGGSEDSILWKRLVKGRQTCEFICSDYEVSRFQGVFVVSAISSKSKVRYFIDDVRRIVNGLIEENITEEMLEEVKKSIVNEDIFECESVESCALDYGSFAVISKASDADDFQNGIISVNIEDVKRAACEYLRDENLSVAVLQAPPVSENATPAMLTLENGIKIILKENHSSPVISVSTKFLAGGLKEDKRNAGISCLAGELLFRSLDSDDKSFQSKLEKIGAKLSYTANKNYVSINMKSVSSNFIPAFDLYIKMLDKGEFPSAYSRARSVLEEQLKKENSNIELQNEYNTLKTLFGSNSPLSYSIYGKADDLSKLKRSDVIDFYKKNFIPSNMVIAIVGDFYASELRDYLLASLGKFSSSNKSSKDSNNKTTETESLKSDAAVFMKNNTNDAHIVFLSKSIPTNDKQLIALNLACRILENSLKSSFREADNSGLMASTVEINNNSFLNDGYFKASVRTNKENVATATQLLNLEIEAFKIGNIPPYILQEAKDALYTEFAFGMTDGMSLADVFSRDELLGVGFDYYTKYDKNLSSVTVTEVKEAAKNYMLPEKKYLIGISSANSSDLIYEDKKLSFKAPKETNTSKDTKNSKESGKTTDNKETSTNKDAPKSNNTTAKEPVKENASDSRNINSDKR